MLAVAGGILLALFILLVLFGAAIAIRNALRWAWHNLGWVVVMIFATVGTVFWLNLPHPG